MTTNLSDHLQIWGFEEDFILFSDGSIGFAFKATPIDLSCKSEEAINSWASQCQHFLSSIPEGIDLQFFYEIGKEKDLRLQEFEDLTCPNRDSAAYHLANARVKWLREQRDNRLLPSFELKIFVRRTPQRKLVQKPSWFRSSQKTIRLAESELKNELQITNRIREDLQSGFEGLGLKPKPLTLEKIADLIYTQWNPDRPISRPNYDPEDVRSSLLFTDVAIDECGFSLGARHHRVLSLKILPDQTFAGMGSLLQGLPLGSRIFLTIHSPNQLKEIEGLQTQRRIAFALSRGKKGVGDIESEAKFQDLETLLDEMLTRGEKVFRVSLNILLSATDREELENQVFQTLGKFRELNGSEGMTETVGAFPIFSEFALPNARASERSKRMKSSNLVDFLPTFGPWNGFSKPTALLKGSAGNLFSFDPFSSELSNANQLVSGGSGVGKSFLTNLLLLQALREGPKIYFVDIGGSYRKLCENLSGQYIPLSIDSKITLNPFDLAEGDGFPSPQKIKFLVSLVELMIKEENETRIPKLERAEIETTIIATYESHPKPTLGNLRENLLNHANPDIRRFGKILTPWCGNTPFGRLIDQKTNVTLSSPIVAFDLKGLESHPDLQSVFLFIITDFVWREVQRHKQCPKYLIFDECWKLLKNESGAAFIEEVFRTFRKYYASAIAISQDIEDFARSKIASAILPNCSIKWVLSQEKNDPNRIKEVLDLNDNELVLLKDLTHKKGVYSQAFLITQAGRSVVSIESTPLEYWIATTDPKDLAVLERSVQESPNVALDQILRQLSEKYPNGVAFEEERL